MRIFLYEFVTGGGWLEIDGVRPPAGSLLTEGAAMLHALATDFLAVPGLEVFTLRDARLTSLKLPTQAITRTVTARQEADRVFEELVGQSDFTLLIAPEFGSHLLRRTLAVERLGKRLLSPGSEIVALASDKWRTYQFFREHGVRTPETWLLDRNDPRLPEAPFPLVVKPIDGCGSLGVQLLRSRNDTIDWSQIGGEAVVQTFCPGIAASLAVLCRPGYQDTLPAFRQTLSSDGRFTYLGGEGPLPDHLLLRAARAFALPESASGYVGIDLVLGEAEDGSQDYAIEINPRLTTSYVGLRALFNENLAQAMLEVALGKSPRLTMKPENISFSADGTVERMTCG